MNLLAIRFRRIEPATGTTWRAFLDGADHCGGCGPTPDEALGCLVFNHPQHFGIVDFRWDDAPPKLTPPEEYPSGRQEPFHTPRRAALEKLVEEYPAPQEWYDEPEWTGDTGGDHEENR